MESKNKGIILLSVMSIISMLYVIVSYENTIKLSFAIFLIVLNMSLIAFKGRQKSIVILVAILYIIDSTFIWRGNISVEFNFLSPLIFIMFAHGYISRPQLSKVLSIIALVLFIIGFLEALDMGMPPILIVAPLLLYLSSLLYVLEADKLSRHVSEPVRVNYYEEDFY